LPCFRRKQKKTWRWISAAVSPFAWRNRITTRTSHLAGFWMDTAILNTHCEHNVGVPVAGDLSPVIRFLSHTTALPFLKKKSLAVLLDLYLFFPDIPRLFLRTSFSGTYELCSAFRVKTHVHTHIK
jgi:hypothetical protein